MTGPLLAARVVFVVVLVQAPAVAGRCNDAVVVGGSSASPSSNNTTKKLARLGYILGIATLVAALMRTVGLGPVNVAASLLVVAVVLCKVLFPGVAIAVLEPGAAFAGALALTLAQRADARPTRSFLPEMKHFVSPGRLLGRMYSIIEIHTMCDAPDDCCQIVRRLEPGQSSYRLRPLGRNTVYWFAKPFPESTVTTFSAGVDARPGDTLTLIFQAANDDGDSTFNLSESFYYVACNTVATTLTYSVRNAIPFTFDGEVWVHTLDIC